MAPRATQRPPSGLIYISRYILNCGLIFLFLQVKCQVFHENMDEGLMMRYSAGILEFCDVAVDINKAKTALPSMLDEMDYLWKCQQQDQNWEKIRQIHSKSIDFVQTRFNLLMRACQALREIPALFEYITNDGALWVEYWTPYLSRAQLFRITSSPSQGRIPWQTCYRLSEA